MVKILGYLKIKWVLFKTYLTNGWYINFYTWYICIGVLASIYILSLSNFMLCKSNFIRGPRLNLIGNHTYLKMLWSKVWKSPTPIVKKKRKEKEKENNK